MDSVFATASDFGGKVTALTIVTAFCLLSGIICDPTPMPANSPALSPGFNNNNKDGTSCSHLQRVCMDRTVTPMFEEVKTMKVHLDQMENQLHSISQVFHDQVTTQNKTVSSIKADIVENRNAAKEIERVIDEVDSWFTSDQNDILDIDNLDVQALEKLMRDTDELESKMASIQGQLDNYQEKQVQLEQTLSDHLENEAKINQDAMGHLQESGQKLQEIFRGQEEEEEFIPEDCDDYYRKHVPSGIFPIYVNGDKHQSAMVYCDQDTAGGGWTVFQRRVDGSVNFTRSWQEYASGFGNLEGNFWLGNELLHNLTKSQNYTLRIDIEDMGGRRGFAQYTTFAIGPESDFYYLILNSWSSGNVGDSMMYAHDKLYFSTYDRDHDRSGRNCAESFHGGWWYNYCHTANLNGQYYDSGKCPFGEGINWMTWTWFTRSLRKTEMKMRPHDYHTHPDAFT